MAKQDARGTNSGAEGVQETSATQAPERGTGTTFDDGQGTVAVDTNRAKTTGTSTSPQAAEWPHGDLPVDSGVGDKVSDEGSGEAGDVERGTSLGDGVAEPGHADRLESEANAAAAYDAQAKLFAEFLAWKQAQQLGAEDQVTNAASTAARVERNQLGLGPEYTRLLAAAPEQFVVTRQLGVSVYIPVEAPEPTAEERKQGAMRPSGLSRQVVVPYRSELPYGTTHEQLQYLLTLGFVAPVEAR